MLFVNQVDGAASETASGHASSTKAGQALGGLDHDVEFSTADLVEIAQAAMGLAHQYSPASQVAGGEGAGGLQRPLVLADDVGASRPDRGGNVVPVLIEQLDGHIAQGANRRVPLGEVPYSFLALFTTRVVGSGRQI